jgi:hypothetical protein
MLSRSQLLGAAPALSTIAGALVEKRGREGEGDPGLLLVAEGLLFSEGLLAVD